MYLARSLRGADGNKGLGGLRSLAAGFQGLATFSGTALPTDPFPARITQAGVESSNWA